jgi:WD40 repeat protein
MSQAKRSVCFVAVFAFLAGGATASAQVPDNIKVLAPKSTVSIKNEKGFAEFSPTGKYVICYRRKMENLDSRTEGPQRRLVVYETSKYEQVMFVPDGWKYYTFSPDERYLCTSDDKSVSMWNLEERRQVANLNVPAVDSLCFVADGKVVVTHSPVNSKPTRGQSDIELKFWDAESFQQIVKPIDSMGPWGEPVVSFDGKTLIGFLGNDCFVVEIDTGKSARFPARVSRSTDLYTPPARPTKDRKLAMLLTERNSGAGIKGERKSPLVFWDFETSSIRNLSLSLSERSGAGEIGVDLLTWQFNRLAWEGLSDDQSAVYCDRENGQWYIKDIFTDQVLRQFGDVTGMKITEYTDVRYVPGDKLVIANPNPVRFNFHSLNLQSKESTKLLGIEVDSLQIRNSLSLGQIDLIGTSKSGNGQNSTTIDYWDDKEKARLKRVDGYEGSSYSLVTHFVPEKNGENKATASMMACVKNEEIEIWTGDRSKKLHTLTAKSLPFSAATNPVPFGLIKVVRFSPDGQLLAVLSESASELPVTVWSIKKGTRLFVVPVPSRNVCDIGFADEGRSLQLFSWDDDDLGVQTIEGIANYTDGNFLRGLSNEKDWLAHDEKFEGVIWVDSSMPNVFSAIAKVKRRGELKSVLLQWDANTKELTNAVELEGDVQGVVVDQGGENLFLKSQSTSKHCTYVLDGFTGRQIAAFENLHVLGISKDGQRCLLGRDPHEGLVYIGDMNSGELVAAIYPKWNSYHKSIISPDGKTIVLTRDWDIEIYEIE